MEANEYMLNVFKEKEAHDKNDDDDTKAPSGGSGEIKTEPESEQENEAREKQETIIIRFCKTYGFSRLHVYCKQARKTILHL